MMIRIKHEGRCRKLNKAPATIEELKAKITELFGSKAAKLDVTYKDCDGELVSVLDTDDLTNCIEEAESFKMTCVTLLLKEDGRTSRSASSKKSAGSISESDSQDMSHSDDDLGFEVVGKKQVAANPQEEAIQKKLLEEKQKAEVELIKKQLIEEHNKALLELDQKTNSRIERIHKHHDGKKSHSHDKCDSKREQQQFMNNLKAVSQICQSESIENPVLSSGKLLKELKMEFPALEFNPALINLVLQDAKDSLMKTLRTSCSKVIAANPELAKASEVNKAKFGAMKCRERGENRDSREGRRGHKDRNDDSRADREERRARKEAKLAMTTEEKEKKNQEREARKLQKEAERAEKHARRAEEKRDTKPVRSDEEKAIKAKVAALKELFPSAKKHQLRPIVEQNMHLSPQELAPLIKASKGMKSN